MKRILIIRLSAIGDVVFASPMIDALRQAHPRAHIAWLLEPAQAELVRHHPGLDEVIVLPRGAWRALWRARRYATLAHELRTFVQTLRTRGFDTAIDLQGLFKSGVWAWLSGARRRIGLGSREGSGLLMTEVHPRGGEDALIGSEYRFLAARLGLDTHDFAMRLALPEAAIQTAEARFGERSPIVLAPFTTRPQKHWFEEAWRALIPELAQTFQAPVVLLGGPDDRVAGERIVADLPALNLCGQTSLAEAAAIIHRARLLIGVDTGLTHMGTAFERPTLCLFGSTRPYLRTESPVTRVIYHALPCAPCKRRPTCGGAYTCMRDITPDEVMHHAQILLGNASAP
ncbi:MAG: glycosyltransferase family 9 protein [Pseudomonadota bacterium]